MRTMNYEGTTKRMSNKAAMRTDLYRSAAHTTRKPVKKQSNTLMYIVAGLTACSVALVAVVAILAVAMIKNGTSQKAASVSAQAVESVETNQLASIDPENTVVVANITEAPKAADETATKVATVATVKAEDTTAKAEDTKKEAAPVYRPVNGVIELPIAEKGSVLYNYKVDVRLINTEKNIDTWTSLNGDGSYWNRYSQKFTNNGDGTMTGTDGTVYHIEWVNVLEK